MIKHDFLIKCAVDNAFIVLQKQDVDLIQDTSKTHTKQNRLMPSIKRFFAAKESLEMNCWDELLEPTAGASQRLAPISA
jgi:hypothetical protein